MNSTTSRYSTKERSRRIGVCLVKHLLLLLLALSFPSPRTSAADDAAAWKPTRKEESDAALFQVSDQVRVIGPTQFPSPTRTLDLRYNQTISILVRPSYGKHRPEADAILAYAEGYQVAYYIMFMETLQATGYKGDVVLAIANDSYLHDGVKEYLLKFVMNRDDHIQQHEDSKQTGTQLNVIIYQLDLDCDGTPDGKRAVMDRSKATDVFQMCRLDHIYGYNDKETGEMLPLKDPREGRVVATLRYEWYWIWTRQYFSHSWLMLIDARDTFFQSNPFADLPRRSTANSTADVIDGLLYFFGENADATRLGKSRKNANWLRNGYGAGLLDALADKPTICSGSSMGEQVALETYLRALINEHDEGSVRMTGSDQGFHNYLYYSGKLLNAATISKLIVWEQGRGMINNLGALRTNTLTSWGVRDPDTTVVYQWDGETPSPVVHQWDRDKDLHNYMLAKHRTWTKEWETKQLHQ
ncbi:hypothetical protein MPSEU_000523700 [Mayamaea pseudoterrestris]|nr:hypothetical protein MPSEU_000523700 [Mayamaea pseudoterrestris]